MEKVLSFLFDILFAPSQDEMAWGEMTAAAFRARAAPCVRDGVLERAQGHALFSYDDPFVRNAIHALKYRGYERLAAVFAQMLRDDLLEDISDAALLDDQPLLIIPIPASKKRIRGRGYNQAHRIVRQLSLLMPDAQFAPDVLVKIRHTKSQTETANREERFDNVKGCFAVADSSRIKGRRIILIDDVITTGATMCEARRALMAGGAASVECIAVAH